MGNVLEEVLVGYAGARNQNWDRTGRRTGITTDFFQDRIPEEGYDPLQNIKNREFSLNDEKYTIDYDYNALSHLISEKGRIEHSYAYDSIGNRLKKDSTSYKINDLNQLVEAEGNIYTFDSNGNLASKTIDGKTWIFQHNALNQLILIKDPDLTRVIFSYDLSGKRLSKKIERQGKKSRVLRFFYLGQTEIGCLDEKGVIVELKIPSNPNNPEAAPSVAIEIKKERYVPIYDLQGNVACLVDPQKRKVVESYRYSAFGEEEITNERGRIVLDSSIGNPWRYRGKRVDQDIGLLYFGYRYYDPEVGRWVSPDPAGNIDGPNLYAFCHNNPLTYVDYFGLASETNNTKVDEGYFYGEYEPHCYCERHRDCKRGGDIADILSGTSLLNIFGHPRFHGSLQALAGFAEVSIGTAMAGTPLAPIGIALLTHGADHFVAGGYAAVTGKQQVTATAQLLQKSGMSSKTADHWDNGANFAFTLGGGGLVYKLGREAAVLYRCGSTQAIKSGSQVKWPSAAKGRSVINGIEYTTHALERMSPRGLVQSGTEIISRGVPPSVVENAISFGSKGMGNTNGEIVHVFENVRVVTNLDGTRVITIITTGQ